MPAVLSDLERNILDYMVQYLRSNTYQPSIREIGEEFGIKSTKTVSEHLSALASKGYLERDPSRSRGVRILGVDLNPQTVSVPCFASIPDDSVGFASDGIEAYYSIDRRMAGAKGCYFLRVRDSALAPLDAHQGDFLLVEPADARALRDGDLAVVRMESRPEIFRFLMNGRTALIRGASESAPSFTVEDPARLPVTGRVAAIFRRFDEAEVPISATAH